MSNRDAVIHAALAALLSVAGAATAQAAEGDGQEQCAGVIKAGQNDCATSMNACHGHVATDKNPQAWIYLPRGTCSKISGARVVQVEVPK